MLPAIISRFLAVWIVNQGAGISIDRWIVVAIAAILIKDGVLLVAITSVKSWLLNHHGKPLASFKEIAARLLLSSLLPIASVPD